MTPEQKAAYVVAQSVAALADIQGMVADNDEAASNGNARPYDHAAFLEVQNQYGLHHNAIMGLFQE